MNRYAVVAAALLLALMVVGVGAIVVVSPFPPPAPGQEWNEKAYIGNFPAPAPEPGQFVCPTCGSTWNDPSHISGKNCQHCNPNPTPEQPIPPTPVTPPSPKPDTRTYAYICSICDQSWNTNSPIRGACSHCGEVI